MHATRRLKVLIVDDNKDAADMLAFILKFAGHEVRVAYDGDIEDLMNDFQPDAFLLDIGLPIRDGISLARLIRDQGWQDSLIITITAYHSPDYRLRALNSGVDHYIVKPADPYAVVRLLDERKKLLHELNPMQPCNGTDLVSQQFANNLQN